MDYSDRRVIVTGGTGRARVSRRGGLRLGWGYRLPPIVTLSGKIE